MKIHAIEAGRVRVTERWRTGEGQGLKRLANALFDKTVTEWLPIYVWIIEHPEGLKVVDTAIPRDANKPRYFPPYIRLMQRAAVFDISLEEEIGHQMRAQGLEPNNVRWVALTHLHQDHDGRLHHFPNSEIVVSHDEWNFACGIKGRLNGSLNQRWPQKFAPTLVNFDAGPFGPFRPHDAH